MVSPLRVEWLASLGINRALSKEIITVTKQINIHLEIGIYLHVTCPQLNPCSLQLSAKVVNIHVLITVCYELN